LKEDILKVIQKADTRQYLISKSDWS
jgi:hypothetical protein